MNQQHDMGVIDFVKQLTAAQSIRSLNQCLKAFLKSYQINTFSFTYYSHYPNSSANLKFDFASENFVAWHQHYLAENYHEIDTTLQLVKKSTLPTFWDLKQQVLEAKSKREKQMREDSMRFGARAGLSIPIHGPDNDFANLLLVQMQHETCLKNWQEFQFSLFTAGYYYYYHVQQTLLRTLAPIARFELSKRELQCLLLIAKQFSIEQMAKELHITERTVNFHIQRLNKKLGTENKYQSVIKAMQQGLILL